VSTHGEGSLQQTWKYQLNLETISDRNRQISLAKVIERTRKLKDDSEVETSG